MNKNIITSSLLLFTAQIFFASNDAIINFLSPQGIQFYHFIFYGSPAYLIVPLYFFIRGELKSKILATNYYIPLFRGIIFLPIAFFAFLCLKNRKCVWKSKALPRTRDFGPRAGVYTLDT